MKQQTLEVREALLLNYAGPHNITRIDGHIFGVFDSSGKKLAEVNTLDKTVRKAKGKKLWSYTHTPFETILTIVLTPVNSWDLVYMIGNKVYEVVCSKKSYIYCTVRKSSCNASNNYRYGKLVIKPSN